MLVKEVEEVSEKETFAIASNREQNNNTKEMFNLICQFLRNPDRDKVSELLKYNSPSEQHLMAWLESNLPVNKLLFIDGHVKRRWPKNYFYELLAYSIEGNPFTIVNYPRRNKNAS
jgi:hypothetical protein